MMKSELTVADNSMIKKDQQLMLVLGSEDELKRSRSTVVDSSRFRR